MSEPEAAMGGVWLASLAALPESEQKRETSPAAMLMSLEGRAAERITFGVDRQLSTLECRDTRGG